MVVASVVPLLFAYALGSAEASYQLQIDFDGYLPIFGGMQQKARVALALSVTPTSENNQLQAKTVLKNLTLSLLDITTGKYEPFNIGLSAVKEYFPDSTITYHPNGAVLKTSAPLFTLPVKLPGLHTQHVPEISFMPLEFPAAGVTEGKSWSFLRKFGDSKVTTTATYKGAEAQAEIFEVSVLQEYDTLEDEFKNSVSEIARAKSRVSTKVVGSGTVRFSGPNGSVVGSKLTAKATSTVYSLQGKATGETRELKISFELEKTKP